MIQNTLINEGITALTHLFIHLLTYTLTLAGRRYPRQYSAKNAKEKLYLLTYCTLMRQELREIAYNNFIEQHNTIFPHLFMDYKFKPSQIADRYSAWSKPLEYRHKQEVDAAMNGNIVAIYGKIMNKLKKIKNLEKNRVKILHRIAKEAQEALGEGRRDEGNDVGKRDAAASIPMRHVLSIVPSNILHGDMVGGASTKAKRASPSASSILNKEIAAYKKAERDWQASKENEKQILRQIDKMYSRDEGSDTQGSGVDDAVTASLDTLSSLDPLVERYFLNGQVTFDEINEIGVKIDEEMINEMVAAGASHEDIQHYKSVITAQPPSTSTCIYQNMHKLFQLSYNKPVDNSNQELQDLRAYHKDVLTKTARIMEPFAPYRIKLKE